MQVEITGETGEIIERLVTSGRYASVEEVVTAMANEAARNLTPTAARLPDPPLPDESISAPCDLPLPPGKPLKVARVVMPLPQGDRDRVIYVCVEDFGDMQFAPVTEFSNGH